MIFKKRSVPSSFGSSLVRERTGQLHMAHSINLCLQECGKQAKVIRDSLSLVQELCNFIRMSPKRLTKFVHIQNEKENSSLSLKPLCPTRWTVRTAAVNSIIINYSVLQKKLDDIGQEASEASPKAAGFCTIMDQF